ncbi:hypothetical protein Dda_2162 [Drechslerella dactyloides]|uniref:DUF7779 domain-containing protein n=1 Tax=Drechslerella dactyloides TaxID=74499 RepID=A0AAD6J303_DREDA|nr:hypothetical protein Dda_2162 [Drechslerella dactyloides]
MCSIIFIHGLRGHPQRTWSHPRSTSTSTTGRNESTESTDARTDKRKSFMSFLRKKKGEEEENNQGQTSTPEDIFWPEEYLVPDLPQARIWTYGYNADVIGGLFQANNQNSVSQHGQDLSVKLAREIDNEALRRSETICKRTRLIIFLGTPHRGSAYASWGEIASNLASLGLQDSNKRLVRTLEVNGEVLDNIHEQFKTVLRNHEIKIHSFQEAKGISGMKGLGSKVVDNFSSKLDLAVEQETVETIDANHMEMVRCCSRDDERYRQIYGILKQFIKTELPNREDSLAGTTNTSSLAKLFMVPFWQDDRFIGREEILGELEIGGQQVAPMKHRRDALVGLGGVGKSQIAIEYAYRMRKHNPQKAVFWIHASSETRFEQAYREMADKLELPGRDDPKVNVLRLVHNWLSSEANGQWLMILDNVDDGRVFFGGNDVARGASPHDQATELQPPLETFLPQSSNGSILITSRNSTAARNLVATFGKLVAVEPMEEAESVELLRTMIPGNVSSESNLKELARSKLPRVTVSTYLSLFRESEAYRASLLDDNEVKDLRRDYSNRHAVITTWQISFDQIKREKTEAADLLALMSMFNRQGIPEWLLLNNMDRLQFEGTIAPLISFSLIREQAGDNAFEMHRLVQLSTRKWIERNGKLEKWRGEAIKVMAELFPSGEYETWLDCQILLPHAREVTSSGILTDRQDLLCLASLNTKLGQFYTLKGNLIMAEPTLREAITIREKELGPNDLDTLTTVNNLVIILGRQGRYEEAELLSRRVLEVTEKELGADHPQTLTGTNNVAFVLKGLGRNEEAELMARRTLEWNEKNLGANHLKTLANISNLAVMLEGLGRYEEAELFGRRALEGSERELGVNHLHTFVALNNLATILEELGRYEEAESMSRRAVEGSKKELGVDHPDTDFYTNCLALLLEKQGKHEEAVLIRRRDEH